MATYNAPRLAQFAGMPSQSSDSILGYIEGLITGESPLPVVLDLPLAQNQTIPAYTPVGYSSGVLVPAVQGTTQAIGITLYDVTVGAVSQWRHDGIPRARLKFLHLARPDVFGLPSAQPKRKPKKASSAA